MSKLPGIALIVAERLRQIEKEGWTAEHDDDHFHGELAKAAACYAVHDCISVTADCRLVVETKFADGTIQYSDPWPFDGGYKPRDAIRNLEKAGALIAAEIDRLLRQKEEELR